MSSPPEAGPSHPVSLSGTTVGQLDPTQPSRILSAPDARLYFAGYDPYTACSARPFAHDDLNSKRIVIETLPDGRSSWRWVPRAKGVDNIIEEGSWPRVIDICGQRIICSQEQWDIYKLDPYYDCVVYPAPKMTTITRRNSDLKPDTKTSSNKPTSKRRKEEVSDDDAEPFEVHKKSRAVEIESDVSSDTDSDDEVEEMVMGEDSELYHARINAARERRQRLEKQRRERREKTKTKTSNLGETQDVSMIDLTIEDSVPQASPQPAPTLNGAAPSSTIPPRSMPGSWAEHSSPPLGMANTWTGSSSSSQSSTTTSGATETSSQSSWGDSIPYPSKPQTSWTGAGKRTEGNWGGASRNNAASDGAGMNGLYSKKQKRGADSPTGPALKRSRNTESSAPASTARNRSRSRTRGEGPNTRIGRLHAKLAQLKLQREAEFMESLCAAVPENVSRSMADGVSATSRGAEPEAQQGYSPEKDPVSLEEKIRRIQEMNAYEAARAREAKEEARRRAEEEEKEKLRRQREQWAREREEAERERREREQEQARRKKQQQEEQERLRKQKEAEESKRRRQQEERWSFGPWTTLRALERYKSLADAFDVAQFSSEDPISFMVIPWPVLHRPRQFKVEDIDWQAVEQFFEAVRSHMRVQDYKTFVEKSHRRFHPDRWRARRVLQSIEDEELKACLEVAANTVAQAITPIWREIKKH